MAGPGRGTHHDRILGELRDRILSREWPPGTRLPFETELAESHGVSRMTMNKVLTQLAREGLVTRRRKLGTVVAVPRAESAALAIPDIAAEVRALGLDHAFRLLARDLRPPTPEEAAEAGPAERVLALEGLHLAGGEPFCHESRIVNPAAAPGALAQDFAAEAPGAWLLRAVPWTGALHRIRAVAATGALARALALRPGEPCLEVTRRTEAGGVWVTLARQTYPGDRHQLLARFGPG